MSDRRLLIVNADDFGQSPGVNRGIIEAHERGIVTSASLMVRWPAAKEAASWARAQPRLGLGLHLDLGEWRNTSGTWGPVYERVDLEDAAAVAAEIDGQLDLFRRLVGREPTHLDSHQHVHRRNALRSLFLAAARELELPLRHFTPAIRYCGDFYGQDEAGSTRPQVIGIDALAAILAALSPGTTELACHPGRSCELDTMYSTERDLEVDTLCAPSIHSLVQELGIELRSFATASLAARGAP